MTLKSVQLKLIYLFDFLLALNRLFCEDGLTNMRLVIDMSFAY